MAAAKGQDTEWQDDALCRRNQLGRDAWLTSLSDIRRGSKTETRLLERRSLAKMQCQICPVQWDCTLFAIATGDQWNIAGIDELERKALVKMRPGTYVADVRRWEEERISVADGVRLVVEEVAGDVYETACGFTGDVRHRDTV